VKWYQGVTGERFGNRFGAPDAHGDGPPGAASDRPGFREHARSLARPPRSPGLPNPGTRLAGGTRPDAPRGPAPPAGPVRRLSRQQDGGAGPTAPGSPGDTGSELCGL